MNASGHEFRRLFIIDSIESKVFDPADRSRLSSAVFDLMEDNHKNGIKVRVIEKRVLVDKVLSGTLCYLREKPDEWDFGLWDDEYVVTIKGDNTDRKMSVSSEPSRLDTARLFRDKAWDPDVSKDWETFVQNFVCARNSWNPFRASVLELPPPNGPSRGDVEEMIDLARPKIANGGKLTILGLTGALMKAAADLKKKQPILALEVIDQRSHLASEPFEVDVQFESANWLQWCPPHQSDVILGDDVICNLGIWQLPLFFKTLANALKRGGVFIVRTTGKPSDGDSPTIDEFASRYTISETDGEIIRKS